MSAIPGLAIDQRLTLAWNAVATRLDERLKTVNETIGEQIMRMERHKNAIRIHANAGQQKRDLILIWSKDDEMVSAQVDESVPEPRASVSIDGERVTFSPTVGRFHQTWTAEKFADVIVQELMDWAEERT
jgi:hypothetical protein